VSQRLNLSLVKDKYILPLLNLPSDLFLAPSQRDISSSSSNAASSSSTTTRWGGRRDLMWRLLDAKSKAGNGTFEDVSIEVGGCWVCFTQDRTGAQIGHGPTTNNTMGQTSDDPGRST
jgi:hypothetical protein